MTERAGDPCPETYLEQRRQPPDVVFAAAIVTWVAASATAAVTLVLALGVLWMFEPVFASFESGLDNPRWFVIGVAAVVIALSVLADVIAVFLLRAHPWARWALLALSVVAALGGLVSAYLVGPLVVTAAAVAVIVLLLLPDARAWFSRVATT